MTMDRPLVDCLIESADSLPYMDYCRLIPVLLWNMYG